MFPGFDRPVPGQSDWKGSQDYKTVEQTLIEMEEQARNLGVNESVDDPFISLAFMSLAVIPELKVTDKGLFDVKTFKPISLEVE